MAHETHRLYDDHVIAEVRRSRAETFEAYARGLMFVLFGIAAMIFAPAAAAEQLGYVENNAGGRIYLTDVDGSSVEGCEETLIAYSTSGEGHMIFGCWLLDGDLVMVRWQDGDMSAFPIDSFLTPDHKLASDGGMAL